MRPLPVALIEVLRLGSTGTDADPGAWRMATHALPALLLAEGGTGWCWRRLRALGLDAALPAGIADALRAHVRDEQARNLLVDEAAESVIGILTELGVEHVLLKGTARRAAADRYPCADARATRDVDLLLPAAAVRPTWERLRASGYSLATDPSVTPVGHFHPPPLLGPERVGIELHSSTDAAVPPDEAWRRAATGGETVTWRGRSVRIPSATELLWHGAAHALREGPAGFRLRFLLDAATVVARGRPIAWEAIIERLAGPEVEDPRHARAWLGTAALLGGGALPAAVGSGVTPFDLAGALAWRLRVARHARWPRVAEALREEGTRALLEMPLRQPVGSTPPAVRLRRRLSSAAARLAFRGWAVARAAVH